MARAQAPDARRDVAARAGSPVRCGAEGWRAGACWTTFEEGKRARAAEGSGAGT